MGSNLSKLDPGGVLRDVHNENQNALRAEIVGGTLITQLTPAGLSLGLKASTILITDTPTKIPPIPLTDRNGISIRVWGVNIVYFGDSSVNINDGYPKRQFEEIILDIRGNSAVEVYAICAPGQSCQVRILEVA